MNRILNIIEEYDARQQTAKLLANSAFGVYGNPNFKYTNYKVAETITAFGRLVHEDMIKLCSDESIWIRSCVWIYRWNFSRKYYA